MMTDLMTTSEGRSKLMLWEIKHYAADIRLCTFTILSYHNVSVMSLWLLIISTLMIMPKEIY
jgi:hypothetical protein